MTDTAKRGIKVISVIVGCAGLLIVLLSLCLLVFGSKTEGTYAETVSVNGSRYTYLYKYNVDGQEYDYVTTRRFPHEEGEHSAQKISYLSFAPSVTYTGAKTAVGMLIAAVGVFGYFLVDSGKNKPKTKPAANGRSRQWDNYLNKVKSRGKSE